jgi:hypothetical protein
MRKIDVLIKLLKIWLIVVFGRTILTLYNRLYYRTKTHVFNRYSVRFILALIYLRVDETCSELG